MERSNLNRSLRASRARESAADLRPNSSNNLPKFNLYYYRYEQIGSRKVTSDFVVKVSLHFFQCLLILEIYGNCTNRSRDLPGNEKCWIFNQLCTNSDMALFN